MVLQRGVQRIGEKAERGKREGAGAAGGVADRDGQDFFGALRGPAGRGSVGVRGAVGSSRRVVGQRAQGAVHGGYGEAGSGVEAAGSLARAAPAHQVPLTGEDHAGDQSARGLRKLLFVREPALRRLPPTPSLHQSGHLRGAARPGLGACAIVSPRVGLGAGVCRRRVRLLHVDHRLAFFAFLL